MTAASSSQPASRPATETLGRGVTRIDGRHALYDAWCAYCERHPEDVADRNEPVLDSESHFGTGLLVAVSATLATFVFSALTDQFDGLDAGTAVGAGVLCLGFWCLVGFLLSLWERSAKETSGSAINRSSAEVVPSPT
jgi:hypothetical protein